MLNRHKTLPRSLDNCSWEPFLKCFRVLLTLAVVTSPVEAISCPLSICDWHLNTTYPYCCSGYTICTSFLSSVFNSSVSSIVIRNPCLYSMHVYWIFLKSRSNYYYIAFCFILLTYAASHREACRDLQTSYDIFCSWCQGLFRPQVPCTPRLHCPIANSAATQNQQPTNLANFKGYQQYSDNT